MAKIALCVSGAARLHAPSIESHRYFLQGHDVDTYCAFWDWTADKYRFVEGTEKEVKDLISLYQPKSALVVPHSLDVSKLLNLHMKLKGLRMFYLIEKCDELRLQSGIGYDLVVRIRPDITIRRGSISLVKANTVVFPKLSIDEFTLKGYEDRMFYGTSYTMNQVSNIFRWLQTFPKGSESGYHEALFSFTKSQDIQVIIDSNLIIEATKYLTRWKDI